MFPRQISSVSYKEREILAQRKMFVYQFFLVYLILIYFNCFKLILRVLLASLFGNNTLSILYTDDRYKDSTLVSMDFVITHFSVLLDLTYYLWVPIKVIYTTY